MCDRVIITLVSDFLDKMGYDYSYEMLKSEANLENTRLSIEDLKRLFPIRVFEGIIQASTRAGGHEGSSNRSIFLSRVFEYLLYSMQEGNF